MPATNAILHSGMLRSVESTYLDADVRELDKGHEQKNHLHWLALAKAPEINGAIADAKAHTLRFRM